MLISNKVQLSSACTALNTSKGKATADLFSTFQEQKVPSCFIDALVQSCNGDVLMTSSSSLYSGQVLLE